MIDMDFTAANQNRPDPSGKLAVNIMHFARVLREAGLPVGPGQVLDALDAANCGCLRSRDDFYWTLHAVFVKRREHREIFDQAFHVFWKKPKMLEQLMQLLFHQITRSADDKAKSTPWPPRNSHGPKRCSTRSKPRAAVRRGPNRSNSMPPFRIPPSRC